MILEAVSCKHCGQIQHVKRYGTTRAGTQRYQCMTALESLRPLGLRAYFDCLDQRLRLVRKAALQGLERKHLTLRTRLKRLTRRTICFSESVAVYDTTIGLFVNQFFFADQRS